MHGEQFSTMGMQQILHDCGGRPDGELAVYTPLGDTGPGIQVPALWSGESESESTDAYGTKRRMTGELSFPLHLVGGVVAIDDRVTVADQHYKVVKVLESNYEMDFAKVEVARDDGVSFGRTRERQ